MKHWENICPWYCIFNENEYICNLKVKTKLKCYRKNISLKNTSNEKKIHCFSAIYEEAWHWAFLSLGKCQNSVHHLNSPHKNSNFFYFLILTDSLCIRSSYSGRQTPGGRPVDWDQWPDHQEHDSRWRHRTDQEWRTGGQTSSQEGQDSQSGISW